LFSRSRKRGAVSCGGTSHRVPADCGKPIVLRDAIEAKFESPAVKEQVRLMQAQSRVVIDNEQKADCRLQNAPRGCAIRHICCGENFAVRHETRGFNSITDQMLDLAAGCFDAPTLNALSRLRLSPKMARVQRLAEKANEGELTPREREEYQSYIKTSEVLTLIQLRAHLKLRLPIPAEA
jgi:hypothetical protein